MKEVRCPNCNKNLGKINESELSVTFEKDVFPMNPTVSAGLVAFPFTCPKCNKTHLETVVLHS